MQKHDEMTAVGDLKATFSQSEHSAGKPKIRVLVVDDQEIVREGVVRLTSFQPDIEVVADCANIRDTVEALRLWRPDVISTEYRLKPGNYAGELVKAARSVGFTGEFLIFAGSIKDEEAVSILQLGVLGIFLKSNPAGSLPDAIRTVCAGRHWLDERSTRALLRSAAGGTSVRPGISIREYDVLAGIITGMSNKEIGSQLHMTEAAVKACVRQLFTKLKASNRAQLAVAAAEIFPELVTRIS